MLNELSSVHLLSPVQLFATHELHCARLPVHYQFPELDQTHVHGVGDAIQPPHPLPPPSLYAFNLSQNQGLFQRANSSHQVTKVVELHLQHQSFQ